MELIFSQLHMHIFRHAFLFYFYLHTWRKIIFSFPQNSNIWKNIQKWYQCSTCIQAITLRLPKLANNWNSVGQLFFFDSDSECIPKCKFCNMFLFRAGIIQMHLTYASFKVNYLTHYWTVCTFRISVNLFFFQNILLCPCIFKKVINRDEKDSLNKF